MKKDYGDKEARAGVNAKLPAIGTFKNQYNKYEVQIEMPEFTSVCPKTGLPDFGKITIKYQPDKLCLELKSLKMYMLGYRNLGIFNENVVNRILQDIVAACRPKTCEVSGVFNPRGGMDITVIAHYPRR